MQNIQHFVSSYLCELWNNGPKTIITCLFVYTGDESLCNGNFNYLAHMSCDMRRKFALLGIVNFQVQKFLSNITSERVFLKQNRLNLLTQ